MQEYFKDADGAWRYRIKGKNGEIMVTSEPYSSRSNARRGFQDLLRVAAEILTILAND